MIVEVSADKLELCAVHIGELHCERASLIAQNDILGQVDNTHLALSDIYSPFHERCLQLSQIHSVGDSLVQMDSC